MMNYQYLSSLMLQPNKYMIKMNARAYGTMESKEKPELTALFMEQCHFPRSSFHHLVRNCSNLEEAL
jgi:hypothetical protein